jgi:hypothetical protein
LKRQKASHLRKMSYELAAAYLKTLVPESEIENIDAESVKLFEADQEQYVVTESGIRLAPYSSKWFYKKLKRGDKDFTVTAEDMGL